MEWCCTRQYLQPTCSTVVFQVVGRDSGKFDIALRKIVRTVSNIVELSGANGGKISRMREGNRLEGTTLVRHVSRTKSLTQVSL